MPTVKGRKVSWKELMIGRRWRRYAFWFIIVFLAILTIRDVVELVVEYSEDPKQADMNIVFNQSMSMPNITFCMSKKQALSHFNVSGADDKEWDRLVDDGLQNLTDREPFLTRRWDFRMVVEAYDVIATLNSMERETTPHGAARTISIFGSIPRLKEKRKLVKKWLDAIQERNVTFSEFTNKVGFEALRRSIQRFMRTTFDEEKIIRTQLKISWISMKNLCFQPVFDAENNVPIEDQGQFFVLQISHNADSLDGEQVDCMNVDFHGRPSAIGRFMEGKGRAKDGIVEELCLSMMHEVTVEVRAQYTMLENDEAGTACRTFDDEDENEFDCRSRCRMEMIRQMCKCTAPTLAHLSSDDQLETFPICDYEKCKLDVQRGNFTDKLCSDKCYPDCHQVRYTVRHDPKGRSLRPDLTTVVLNWGSFEYLTLEQQWVWSVTTFIAALGGSIGMWLGLSILSLIQLLTYMAEKLSKRVGKTLHVVPENKDEEAAKSSRKQSSASVSANPFGNGNVSANPFENPYKSKESAAGRSTGGGKVAPA
ncbi:Protein DEL-6 a [Aphelenchoides avenae]|nr:Protein DEL-6 a [Aphelenchus avenae]